jgi:predicted nucleic acid-binding protein
MTVISDTSCIGYLIIIDKLIILKENFSKIIIPETVHKEVLQLSSKHNLNKYLNSRWISSLPITNRNLYRELLNQLDEGEAEAIVLSQEFNADLLLIDERRGTIKARSLGIKTIGLLGVLLLSKERQLIPSVKPLLDKLMTNTTFRIDKSLYTTVLKQANEQ